MNLRGIRKPILSLAAAAALLPGVSRQLEAKIVGVTGPAFSFTAKADQAITGDGNSVLIWGYANGGGRAQIPGPTMIVNQGDVVTVTLTNALVGQNVSIVFPGQQGVTAAPVSGGTAPGLITLEAQPGGTVQYTFVASHPGTYLYQSGTNPDLQVEMGLSGALIVRPALGANCAYNHAGSCFDREYLFFLTEMDPRIHQVVEFQGTAALANTNYLSTYFSNYWFLNGRNAPDSLSANGAPWLPTQPYGSLARMHLGDKVLMRVVGGNRDMHPFHHHGNHARIIAVDGRLLESAPGAGPDLSHPVFSIQSHPGGTVDAIFEWTGKDLGWDAFGTTAAGAAYAHQCNGKWDSAPNPTSNVFDPVTREWCGDHGKPLPVVLPENQNLAFGAFWSGSPFLGKLGPLPPGEGGFNPNGGFPFMWHSHTEKELTNYDIFPGGMMTFMIVEAMNTPITE